VKADFADTVRLAREKAGLTQADLARLSSLTASYISLLENRKKPPPSNEVVEKIASVLGLSSAALLDAAHLGRAPQALQQRLTRLEGGLRRQRGMNKRILDQLLPLTLFNVTRLEGYLEAAIATLGHSFSPKSRLRRFFSRLSRAQTLDDVQAQSSEIIEKLNEREFEHLLEILGGLEPTDLSAFLPVYREVPPAPAAASTLEPVGQEPVLPSALAAGRYYFSVPDEAMYPRLEEGDLLLADEEIAPRNGDIVLVRFADTGMAAKYIDLGGHVEFSPANPQVPPLRFATEDTDAFQVCATAVSLRRAFR
jgi:transcriptional regulator with XRE-family HTH domain